MKIDSISQTLQYYTPSAQSVAKCAITMATSAVALNSLSSLTGADAGPITYGICVAACTGVAPPALPACIAACFPALNPFLP